MTEKQSPLDSPPEKPLKPVHDAVKKTTAPGGERRYRSWIFQTYILLSLLAFSALALVASSFQTNVFDITITRKLQEEAPAWVGTLLVWVSWFGFPPQSFLIIPLGAIVLYLLGLRMESLVLLITAVSSGAINQLIKIAIRRPRPGADLVQVIQELNSYSFPSGHVMFYTAFFGFLAFLAFTLIKRGWLRMFTFLFFSLLVLLVGPSRIYMGEHWASDVIGAYLLGFLILWGAIFLYRWGKVRYSRNQPVAPGREEGLQPIPITGEKKKP